MLLYRPSTKNGLNVPYLPSLMCPTKTAHTDCIAFDFAICKDANGELTPQLIELQGFPTLFAFQAVIAQAYRKFMDIPKNFDVFLGGYTEETYLQASKN
jgi:hypothetical protein